VGFIPAGGVLRQRQNAGAIEAVEVSETANGVAGFGPPRSLRTGLGLSW